MLRSRLKGSQVDLAQADALQLPLAGCCMDGVLYSFTIELLEPAEMLQALRECRQVLRDSGQVGVVCESVRRVSGLCLAWGLRWLWLKRARDGDGWFFKSTVQFKNRFRWS